MFTLFRVSRVVFLVFAQLEISLTVSFKGMLSDIWSEFQFARDHFQRSIIIAKTLYKLYSIVLIDQRIWFAKLHNNVSRVNIIFRPR